MKTTVKALLLTILFIAIGVGVHYAHRVATGQEASARRETQMQELFIVAKEMFLEKNETIQTLTLNIYEQEGLRILSIPDGGYIFAGEVELSPESRATAEPLLAEVFGEYECGGLLKNIAVTDTGTFFYAAYDDPGTIGFVRENTINNTESYNTADIIDEWKLFYSFNKGD
jgi:hypothetical protein